MIKKTASVSIIAANYNNGKYLEDFISSINESSVLPKELIIIDDGSTDNSIEIIESYLCYGYIRLIKIVKNKGFANALNHGIELCSGKYIARIDPDDIMISDRLEKQFMFLEKNHEIDLVGGNVTYFNSDTGKAVSNSNFPANHTKILNAYKAGDNGVQHPTVFVKSKVMKKYKYKEGIFPSEDYDIFARMINDGYKFANILESVNMMRVHPKSAANNVSYEAIQTVFILRKEIFNVEHSGLQVRRYYKYISNYRKFLISRNFFSKYLFIFIASFYYPSKLLKKIF